MERTRRSSTNWGITGEAGGTDGASWEPRTAFSVLAKAKGLEAQGRDVIHLEIGEPDFDTPAHVVEAGCRALRPAHPLHPHRRHTRVTRRHRRRRCREPGH
jgi:aspartate/methionine/tyrosine aminotransferase